MSDVRRAQQKSEARDKFILRFDSEGQRQQIKERAARNHRTMNAELLTLIEAGMRALDGQGLIA